MSIVSESIGKNFEEFLWNKLPELKDKRHITNSPDFWHNSGFYIEAKVGYWEWGPRIKIDQIKKFESFDNIVYALGMHDFKNSFSRFAGKNFNEAVEFLKPRMNILENYFVAGEIVDSIWAIESRTSEKGKRYCTIKPSILRNIIRDRPFKRFGEKIEHAYFYYGFNPNDYVMKEANSKDPVGCILKVPRDLKVIDYLSQKGLLK